MKSSSTMLLCKKLNWRTIKKHLNECNVEDIFTNRNNLVTQQPNTDQSNELMDINCCDKEYKWVEHLKKKLMSSGKSPLWLNTNNKYSSGLLGMFNCLKRETGGSRLRYALKCSKKLLKIVM